MLKNVAYSDDAAAIAKKKFLELKRTDAAEGSRALKSPGSNESVRDGAASSGCDIFLSSSHEDSEPAQRIHQSLLEFGPRIRVFYDKTALAPGASWLNRIADSPDSARRVVAVYSPSYRASKYCKDEFSAAYMRQTDTGGSILFPIHYRSARIPYLYRTVQYSDCREAAVSKVSSACQETCAGLSRPAEM